MSESITSAAGSGGSATQRKRWTLLSVLLPWALLVGTGLRGLDFGTHWDENEAFLQPLRTAVEEGNLLPRRYNYPSLGFAITVAALAPEAISSLGAAEGVVPALRSKVLAMLPKGTEAEAKSQLAREGPSKDFLLRLRLLFLLAGALAVLWVHLAVLARGGTGLEALLASTLLGLSFEVSYHLRWVAPDGLLMATAALTLLLATMSMNRSHSLRWVLGAAVAAGLACSAKYPGGLLLIPAALAALRAGMGGKGFSARSLGRGALFVLAVAALFCVTFALTSPAVLLDSDRFWVDVKYERIHYTQGGHGLHTVAAGWEHLTTSLRYLCSQGLSNSPLLATVLSLLALLGIVRTVKEDRWIAALLILMPLVHLGYISSVRVFMVRNLIVLLPFMALLAARGAAWLLESSPVSRRGWVAPLFLGVLCLTNGFTLISAAGSIDDSWPEQALRDLAQDLRGRSPEPVYVTPSIRLGLQELGLAEGLEHLTGVMSEDVHSAAAYRNEIGGGPNMRWTFSPKFIKWYGSREVNLAYYPTWPADKLIWISTEALAENDLFLRPLASE